MNTKKLLSLKMEIQGIEEQKLEYQRNFREASIGLRRSSQNINSRYKELLKNIK